MVRVRLEGLPEEVHRIADAMQAAGACWSVPVSTRTAARAGMSACTSTAICLKGWR